VVNSFPFPQGDEGSIPIMVKLNEGEWGKRGQGQETKVKAFKMCNPSDLNTIFCEKNLLFAASFKLEIKLCLHA